MLNFMYYALGIVMGIVALFLLILADEGDTYAHPYPKLVWVFIFIAIVVILIGVFWLTGFLIGLL